LKTEANVKQYEAMFLVDSAIAATDWEGILKTITTILEKAGAEILSLKKWDERKLVYEIRKTSRGTYLLCYFRAATDKIGQIERDVQLSEKIIRVLILTAEHLTKEDMEKDTPLTLAEKQQAPVSSEAKPAAGSASAGLESAATGAMDSSGERFDRKEPAGGIVDAIEG
jgi:small subunit ribosomal protein S6